MLFLLILYAFFLTFILLYSLHQVYLTVLYIRARRGKKEIEPPMPNNLPLVTIQLPVYNERYVIDRLINAVANFNYPKEKMHIQVLDDSDDETIEIIANRTRQLKEAGFDIRHIRRGDREGFKAGALQYGLDSAPGEFIAIFDADFVPDRNFLQRTLPWFQDKKTGMVQTRWGHINQDYNLLTRVQSYALNAHFTVEQGGRNSAGYFINFNGTAGIWRKKAIENAGSWEADTLTEDLDLSYRAQLKGWRFKYLENVVSPAELPVEMNGLKSQQFRWAKGAAECARKNLGKVLRSRDFSLSTKISACFHLFNSFMWVCLTVSGLLLLSLLYGWQQLVQHPLLSDWVWGFFQVYNLSFLALYFFYLVANRAVQLDSWKSIFLFTLSYPLFLSLSMGIAFNNAIGVVEGYLGKKTSFVRTPKFNLSDNNKSWYGNIYVKRKVTMITWLEALMAVIFGWGFFMAFMNNHFGALPFLLMMSGGYTSVLWTSYIHHKRARQPDPVLKMA